jgi:hypothetical protein
MSSEAKAYGRHDELRNMPQVTSCYPPIQIEKFVGNYEGEHV